MPDRDNIDVPMKGLSLFDGFEWCRTPSDTDYIQAIKSGMVAPDTNVLLNLYRYNDDARADLLAVLTSVGDRLWVAHQVVVEYWRNRESASRDPQTNASQAVKDLADRREQALVSIRTWANRIALSEDESQRLQEGLHKAFDEVIDSINSKVDSAAIGQRQSTESDPILRDLAATVAGRVGAAPNSEELEAAKKEAKRRIDAGEPPAYKDRSKNENAEGDYLVWSQIIREAMVRKLDVLFVTGDAKEDWWIKVHGQLKGPRLELVKELRDRADVRLLMIQPTRLLQLAREALAIDVRDESLNDAARVDQSRSESRLGGWTRPAVAVLLRRLSAEAPVQAAAVRVAAENGGFVSRDEVYALGAYRPGRTLRGFTRPVNRITQGLREQGLIPEESDDFLVAVYDPKISYVQAAGFQIPESFVGLVDGAMESDDLGDDDATDDGDS